MKVALYARVSTEEQARHGISIEAQIAALQKWACEQNQEIVGEYIDNGISARKAPSKRPALQSLLQDIPSKQIELIAFCKLDRWTRNVKGYYQVQEILDRYKVAWAAIQEDYETITASGRFKVNIMLSVAENEADRTSERIKSVFEHKVNIGQPITQSLPLGLRIDGKKIVADENAPIVAEAFKCYVANGTKSSVKDMLSNDYGLHISITSINNLLHNKLYIGEYRGNKSYCEPIIPSELFNRVQNDLERRSTRKTPSGRIYLFSGLIICGECGRRFSSLHKSEGRDYYRCSCGHSMYRDCPNPSYVREDKLEEAALNALSALVKGIKIEYQQSRKRKPAANKQAITQKLERLKDLYIDGDITKEKYRQQRDALQAQIAEVKEEQSITELCGENFLANYNAMQREQRKTFWRSVIDYIEVNAKGEIGIFFKT